MKDACIPPSSAPEFYALNTDEFAAQLLVLPQTVRKQYSQTGSYFGAIPLRLPNRKLLWPRDTVEKLLTAQRTSESA